MFGIRVIGNARKLTMPRTTRTRKLTMAGMGRRIDQAEMASLIGWPPGRRPKAE